MSANGVLDSLRTLTQALTDHYKDNASAKVGWGLLPIEGSISDRKVYISTTLLGIGTADDSRELGVPVSLESPAIHIVVQCRMGSHTEEQLLSGYVFPSLKVAQDHGYQHLQTRHLIEGFKAGPFMTFAMTLERTPDY